MAPARSESSLIGLITRLCALPESGWIEFKENNTDPDRIGQYISALSNFEMKVAADGLSTDEVLSQIDYPTYFELYGTPLPPGSIGVLEALAQEKFVWQNDDGTWAISNLGALLFAKDILSFDALARKMTRVVIYRGKDRLEAVKEQSGRRGYASGFASLVENIINALPTNEVIGQALRRSVPMYPELAVRELVANSLIHQDFSVTLFQSSDPCRDGSVRKDAGALPACVPAMG